MREREEAHGVAGDDRQGGGRVSALIGLFFIEGISIVLPGITLGGPPQ